MDASTNTNTPFTITGNWALQSEQLKKKFTQLTDTDLKFETGQEGELLKRIQGKLSKSREDVISILKNNHVS